MVSLWYNIGMEEKIVTFLLRIPEPLKLRLDAAAKKERRSLHAQILFLLESALEKQELSQ